MTEQSTQDLIASFERDAQYGAGCIYDRLKASLAGKALVDDAKVHLPGVTAHLEANTSAQSDDTSLAWRKLLEDISKSRKWDFKPPDWCRSIEGWLRWLKLETNYFPNDPTVAELITSFEHEIKDIEEVHEVYVIEAVDASNAAAAIIERGKHSLPAIIAHLEENRPKDESNRYHAWVILMDWLSGQYSFKRHQAPIHDQDLDVWLTWAKLEAKEYQQ